MTACPYEDLLEQQILGILAIDEVVRLTEHTEKCSQCKAAYSELQDLENLFDSQSSEIDGLFQPGRPDLLARISKEIRNTDDYITPRRLRRLNSRFILYAIQLVAVVMIVLIYVASMASVMTLKRREQVRFTKNEIRALVAVTRTYRRVNQKLPPKGNASLVDHLSQPMDRKNSVTRPYFPFDPKRLNDGLFMDAWKRPYVYRTQMNAFEIYSLGPNGQDESGAGDDIKLGREH